jgi:hypothetical protein
MVAACPLAVATIPATITIRIGFNRRSKRYRQGENASDRIGNRLSNSLTTPAKRLESEI